MNATATKTQMQTQTQMTPRAQGLLSGGPQPRRPVVLLRYEGAAHLNARRWAGVLAAAFDTELIVVRLIEERALRLGGVLRPAAAPMNEALKVIDARVRWQRRFGEGRAQPALISLPNEGTSQLAQALATLGPQVVVLGSARTWPGDCVAQLATESGTPFLIARPARTGAGVVAATSLTEAQFPVLKEAQAWATALGRPLTLLHNIEPRLGQSLRTGLEEKMETFAQEHGAAVAFTRAYDPVSSILDVARADDADVIVVGASASRSDAARRVAPRIVSMAKRSVMVVPLSRRSSLS
ncbi:MAG: universal stress protein [Archangium sp.]|nr:universal stress protein [Archangium sp.]